MRAIVLGVVMLAFVSGMAYAAMPTEKDYEDLGELRVKIVRLKREMDKFIKDIMATYPADETVDPFGQDIRVDVNETDTDIVVRADLPGMDKDKIEVTLTNNRVLRIAGSREITKEEKAPGMVRQERLQGRFERVLELPAEGRSDGIDASYRDGVLEIVIPKMRQAEEKPVKIGIK